MDRQQINRVGGRGHPNGWRARDSEWGGGAGPTTWMAGQTYSAVARGAVQRQNNKASRLQSSYVVFQDNDGNELQRDCRRAKEVECRCQEEGRPGGGGQDEAGQGEAEQVVDQAHTQC